jgi:hypothetical protein
MKENEGTSDATAEAVEPFSTGRGPVRRYLWKLPGHALFRLGYDPEMW